MRGRGEVERERVDRKGEGRQEGRGKAEREEEVQRGGGEAEGRWMGGRGLADGRHWQIGERG